MTQANLLQTGLKTLAVLRLLSESGRGMTMSEVAERTGLGKSISFRIVKTLEEAGFIARGEGKRYRAVGAAGTPPLGAALDLLRLVSDAGAGGAGAEELRAGASMTAGQVDEALTDLEAAGLIRREAPGRWGVSPGLLGYARPLFAGDPVLQALRPVMKLLSEETGETVTWFRLDGESQVVVDLMPSPHPISYTLTIGERHRIERGAGGLACLAFLPDAEIAAIAGGDALAPRIAEIRAAGYAVSRGERVEGAAAAAAPVFGVDGRLAGSLGVMGPEFRMNERRAHEAGKRLKTLTTGLFAPPDAATEYTGREAAQ